MSEKKRSVGIITLYYHNYNLGGMLQAYALQHTIEGFGVRCEQISYDRLCELPHKKTLKGKWIAEAKEGYHALLTLRDRVKQRKRTKNFRSFEAFIPHSERVYGNFSMPEACREYDAFVCGSDQIWNDWNACQEEVDCNTLHFVPNDRPKVAYAVSTGSTEFSKQFEEKIGKGLTELSAISVREKSAVPMIERISGKPVSVQLDPTLLLASDEWESVANKGYVQQKSPYILCYFLGENQAAIECAARLADKEQKQVVFLPFGKSERGQGNIQGKYEEDRSAGPREFLALIQNAELILTDSFHAMVFSVIFHKSFYVFPRNTKVGLSSMNSRVTDFLSMIGMEDRLVKETEQVFSCDIPIDYRFVDEIIREKAQCSKEFLLNALNIHPLEDSND